MEIVQSLVVGVKEDASGRVQTPHQNIMADPVWETVKKLRTVTGTGVQVCVGIGLPIRFITPRVSDGCNSFDIVCLCVCLSGCTQGTLYPTTTVYGVLVHQEGAIGTTQAQYAPRCTRETMFFEKFRGP